MWQWFAVAAFVLLVVGGWVLALVGMPGAWLIVATAAVYAWLIPADSTVALSWTSFAALVALALGGELWEMAAGSVWSAGAGASRRGVLLALVGAMAGSLVGAVVGLPIPFIGWLLGAILLSTAGAMIGAILGELWYGRPAGEIWKIGKAALWGRLFGTVGKLVIVTLMTVICLGALAR